MLRYAALAFCASCLLTAAATPVHAEAFPVTLTLPVPGATNQLAIDGQVLTSFGNASDSATMDLAGSIDAVLDVDLSGASPVVTGLTLVGGQITGSDVSLSFSLLGGLASGVGTTTDLAGTATTNAPPSAVAAGSFDAADHTAILNQGVVAINGSGPGIGAFGETTDLTVEPFAFAGNGTGTITLNPLGGSAFGVTLLLPIDDQQADNVTTGIDFTLAAAGTIQAQGTLTVPEPASAVALTIGLLAAGSRRRRRDSHPT